MKIKNSPIPPCPHCDDNTGECKHVLVNYDRSFGEYLSGYLAKRNPETETFEAEMIDLMEKGIIPRLSEDEFELASIWEYAVDSYVKEDRSLDLDSDSYFKLLESSEDVYDTISFSTPDDNYEEGDDDGGEIPGYSSAGIIFYSEDPPSSIKAFNNDIIENLKSV